MTNIPFEKPIYVTRPIFPPLERVNARLVQIWQAQQLTNVGDMHRELEDVLKKELRAPYLSLFNNGTNALLSAVDALGLQGEVITTPFTFAATPHCLSYRGIQPVFCDIEEESMTLDPQRIEEKISKKTSGILGVHVYGIPCRVEEIDSIAKRNQLKVLYDAAHAFGVEIFDRPIGDFGDMSMFSFHATKLFHTAEGGCLWMKDPVLKSQVDLLKNFGIRNENEVGPVGINGKMSEVHAAIGLEVFKMLEEERSKRQEILKRYQKNLSGIDGIRFVGPKNTSRDSLQYFVVRILSGYGLTRDHLYQELKKWNVFTRKYFFPLCSQYECYQHLESARPENLPVAHKMADEVLSLPFYGELSLNDVDRICEMILEVRHAI